MGIYKSNCMLELVLGLTKMQNLLMRFLSIFWLLWELDGVLDELEEVFALTHKGGNLRDGVHLESIDSDVFLSQQGIHFVRWAVTGHDRIDLPDDWVAVVTSIHSKQEKLAIVMERVKLTCHGRNCS